MIVKFDGKKAGTLNIEELQKNKEDKRSKAKKDQDLINQALDERMPVIRAGATPVTEKDRQGQIKLPTIDDQGRAVLYNPNQQDVAVRQSTIDKLDEYGQEAIPVPSPFTSTPATANTPATESGEEVDYLELGPTGPQSRQDTATLANMDVETGRQPILTGQIKQIAQDFDLIVPKSNTAKDSPQEFVKGIVSGLEKSNRGEDNLFGKMTVEIAPDQQNLATLAPQEFLKETADTVNFALRSTNKLNVSTDPNNVNSPIRGLFPAAFMMGMMSEILASYDDQTSEDGKPSARRFNNAVDRDQLGKKASRAAERFMYPSDEAGVEFGERESIGYKSRLSEREHDALGQYFSQAFADSDLFPWFETQTIESTATGQKKVVFQTSRLGDISLARVRRGLKQALGLDKHKKPVRTVKVPFEKGSSSISDSNNNLKILTRPLSDANPAKAMLQAIQLLNDVAFTPDPKSTLLLTAALNNSISNLENKSPILEKYVKQTEQYYNKKKREFLEDFLARERNEGLTVEQLNVYDKTRGEIVTAESGGFNRIAEIKTEAVMKDFVDERKEITEDAITRMYQTVYYDNMAVGASGRLMQQNDELSPVQHKWARAIMKPANPTVFKKTDPKSAIQSAITKANRRMRTEQRKAAGYEYTTEEKFMVVMARTLVPKADKLIIKDKGFGSLLTEFARRYDEFVTLGKPIIDYAKANGSQLAPANLENLRTNYGGLPPLVLSPDFNDFLASHGKDEWYFAYNNISDLADYHYNKIEGQQLAVRSTAEADGLSNGATIQGFQMGIRDILIRGGVAFKSQEEIEGDIRDWVFEHISLLPQIHSDNTDWETWQLIFADLKEKGMGKELLKKPIMTSVFGLEPRFQQGAARSFINDNPEFFFPLDMTLDQKVESLTVFLKEGLENVLGGALEHATVGKRVARIFNFANRLPKIDGPLLDPKDENSHFTGIFGGKTSNPTSREIYTLPTDREIIITTNETVDNPLARSKTKKILPGEYTSPTEGSASRNAFPVNTTHMIDSAIMTRTIISFLTKYPNAFVQQQYDAIISDPESFIELVEEINYQFKEVNNTYELLEKEGEAFFNLRQEIRRIADDAEQNGELINLNRINGGEFYHFGEYLANDSFRQAVVYQDVPGPDPKKKEFFKTEEQYENYKALFKDRQEALNASETTAKSARLLPEFANGKRKLKPSDFVELFFQTIKDLKVQSAHNKLREQVKKSRAELKKTMLNTDNFA